MRVCGGVVVVYYSCENVLKCDVILFWVCRRGECGDVFLLFSWFDGVVWLVGLGFCVYEPSVVYDLDDWISWGGVGCDGVGWSVRRCVWSCDWVWWSVWQHYFWVERCGVDWVIGGGFGKCDELFC